MQIMSSSISVQSLVGKLPEGYRPLEAQKECQEPPKGVKTEARDHEMATDKSSAQDGPGDTEKAPFTGLQGPHIPTATPAASTPPNPGSRPPNAPGTAETPASVSQTGPPQANSGLLALLGPNVTAFPYSEQAYIDSIRLRTEQERTKQEFYRLEVASKNLAIMQLAVRAKIPSHMIPMMCVGGSVEDAESRGNTQKRHTPPSLGPEPVSTPGSSGDARFRSRELDSLNASPVAPLNFRFGAGSSSRRPLSPAKIGAAAVANLATPITPYRSSLQRRTLPLHQRHFSMPTESTRSDISRTTSAPVKRPGPLQSPQGSTSAIQVRPAPAQPLQQQQRSALPPSQELMTLLQHIIQFHHWQPEMGGPGPPQQQAYRFQPIPQSHKRHKLNSGMSIDMTAQDSDIKLIKEESDNDQDMLMDTSTTTAAEPRDKDQRNLGRYPHDILSPTLLAQ